MTANRSRKQHVQYVRYNRGLKKDPAKCVFCIIKSTDSQFVRETDNFWVVYNIYPYSIWDDMKVLDHLMLIPKTHTDNLASLSKDVSVEYVQLISEYEAKGYGIWARPVGSTAKSIEHQHTHFIKGNGKRGKFLLYSSKPYTRVRF